MHHVPRNQNQDGDALKIIRKVDGSEPATPDYVAVLPQDTIDQEHMILRSHCTMIAKIDSRKPISCCYVANECLDQVAASRSYHSATLALTLTGLSGHSCYAKILNDRGSDGQTSSVTVGAIWFTTAQ